MSQYVETPTRTFENGATAIPYGARVVLSGGKLALAGLADNDLGVAESRIPANTPGAVRLRTAQGTRVAIAAKAIAAGDLVYTAADGKVSDASAATSYLRGTALTAAAADGDLLEVLPAFTNTAEV